MFLMAVWYASCALGFDISTAYQDTAPKFMFDEHGQASGICVDIFSALEAQDKRLYFSRPKYFTPIRRIFHDMEKGTLMVYCGAGFNIQRANKMRYSQVPLYPVSTLLVASRKNTRIYSSIEDLKSEPGLGFNAINDTSTYKLLGKLGLSMPGHYIKTVEQGLGLVLRDRDRVFAYHSLGLKHALRNNRKWHGLKLLPVSLRDYEHWMVFNKTMKQEQYDAVNAALIKLRDKKVIEKILGKYQ